MKNNRLFPLILIVALSLFGCQNTPSNYVDNRLLFTGPGNIQEFMKVRYSCLQETGQRVSGGVAIQYGAAASSSVIPSCGAFNTCLASRGYFRNINGNLDVSGIPISCQP